MARLMSPVKLLLSRSVTTTITTAAAVVGDQFRTTADVRRHESILAHLLE